jgi:YD repeat-containing protein
MRHSKNIKWLSSMSMSTKLPPYPRIAECYRTLAVAFDTKASNRDVDGPARKGDYDWSLLSKLGDELILAPLEKYVEAEFADFVGQWLDHVHGSYRELVSSVAVDSLSRTDTLPILIPAYFAPQALGLIVGMREKFGGPELTRLLDPATNPIVAVLDWLDQGEDTPLIKLAFPGTTDTDRSDREMVQKWTRGPDLPRLASIKKFADAVDKSGAVPKEKTMSLRRWLVLARALAYVEKDSSWPVRAHMLRHLLLGMPDVDVQSVLSMAVNFSAKKYSALTIPALALYEDLKRLTHKQPGDQERTRLAIDDLERLTEEHDPEGHTSFHLQWMKGRWHALSGRLEQALYHYEKAVELGSYRAGAMLKSILEESLALAAFLEKKPSLKRLKNQAVAARLLADPQGEAVIEDWEVAQIGQQFRRLFPPQGRFEEAPPIDEEKPHLGFLVFDQDETDAIRPDLANPDRVRTRHSRDGQVRRWPQLRFFSSIGKAQEVAALLHRGASVDLLDEAGGSALLCAIQYAEQIGDRRVLDLLLQKAHDQPTLDSATAKKQLTPLICAIDYGEPDVVEKLLRMGATADRRGNIVDETPLYHVMGTLASVLYPGKLNRVLHDSFTTDPDLMKQEALRRYGVSIAGVFGDGRALGAMAKNARHKELLEKLITAIVKERVARHTVPKLIRIAELLLERGANPNAQHRYPAPGRSPLMLAAENNSALAFDLMMRYRGNPYQTDAAGLSCVQIAMGFRAAQVVSYLRGKGIM